MSKYDNYSYYDELDELTEEDDGMDYTVNKFVRHEIQQRERINRKNRSLRKSFDK